MPRRKFIDKKSATTFALVHRAQNDPLIHDSDASAMVFAERPQPLNQRPRRPTEDDYAYSSAASVYSSSSEYRSGKTRQRGDLEEEFGLAFRPNEGQAAQHGVFFDDTEYDYMQHMRDLGSGEGPVTWVEAAGPLQKKGKERLEDALRSMQLGGDAGEGGSNFDDAQSVGVASVGTQSSIAASLGLPEGSEFVRKITYQDQQDVADDIARFQPDMDPDLRQVLEALDDEAYVDDDDDDLFGRLTTEGVEVDGDTYARLAEQDLFDEDENGEGEDGYETDDTLRASTPPPAMQILSDEQTQPPSDALAPPPADPTDGTWIDEFKKYQSASKQSIPTNAKPASAVPSAAAPSALSSLASGRRKKRRGAKTSTSNYSMTSSALARTDQQTLLDSRFDKIEEDYAAAEFPEDDEGEDGRFDDALSVSAASGVSKASRSSKLSNASGLSGVSSYSRASDSGAPMLVRSDFDSVLDEFLSGNGNSKSRRGGKKGGNQTGLRMLDELREGLGPARVRSSAAATNKVS